MATVFRHEGLRFFFYSNEGDPREPPHIHVMAGVSEAKFWLSPEVTVVNSTGFDARTLRRIVTVFAGHRDQIERAWHDHFR